MSEHIIRLDDLAHPVLNDVERQFVETAPAVEMTEEAVLSAARERSGLSDFGVSDFRERLKVWLRAVDEDRGLGPLGRATAFDEMVRYAVNRLQLEHLVKEHPEIQDVEIDRPIIVAGLPRSGTTHLVNILASDPRLRSMQLWESMMPFPLPDEQPGPPEQSPRFTQTQEMWKVFGQILQHMPAMHEMEPDHVHEDIELQGLDFTTYLIEWRARVPRWTEYYYRDDQAPQYRYGRKALQALTWLRGPNRWVMKSPPHMENLRPLITTYPDATIALTHRDPVAVIQSAVTLLAYWDRIRRTEMDLPGLAKLWIDRIEHMLRACVRDRDAMPEGQVVDVIFHDYMADQRGVIDRIYATAGLEITPEADARIDGYLNANPRGKHGKVAYDLIGHFGIDVAELRNRFQFYYDRFPVRKEPVLGEKL
ncbi:MAG: sulfotransferase [Sphingomonadaceae bacterium]